MPVGNMVFFAMLTEEYVLIVPLAYQLQSGLDESRMAGTGKPSNRIYHQLH